MQPMVSRSVGSYCSQHVEYKEEIRRPAEDQIRSEIASAARGCCGERHFFFFNGIFVLQTLGRLSEVHWRTCRRGDTGLIFTTIMEISDAG